MKIHHFLLVIISVYFLGIFVIKSTHSLLEEKPYIELPEEYKMIDSTTAIIGYYDSDSILHIEFDNRIQFEWESAESDIPEDKSYIQISGTVENTVYLNPIDE